MAERYHLNCGIYRDIGEAIKDSGANLVFNVTVPEAHYHITTTALKMGCHVLSEKPMASSLEEAEEMVAIAQEAGKMFAVMQNRRYLKNIRAFHDLIKGTIGAPGLYAPTFFLDPILEDSEKLWIAP